MDQDIVQEQDIAIAKLRLGFERRRNQGHRHAVGTEYLLGKKSSKLETGLRRKSGRISCKGKTVYYTDAEWYSDQYNSYEKVTKSYQYTSSGYQSVISSSATSATAISDPMDSCFVQECLRHSISVTNTAQKISFYPYLGFGWSF